MCPTGYRAEYYWDVHLMIPSHVTLLRSSSRPWTGSLAQWQLSISSRCMQLNNNTSCSRPQHYSNSTWVSLQCSRWAHMAYIYKMRAPKTKKLLMVWTIKDGMCSLLSISVLIIHLFLHFNLIVVIYSHDQKVSKYH